MNIKTGNVLIFPNFKLQNVFGEVMKFEKVTENYCTAITFLCHGLVHRMCLFLLFFPPGVHTCFPRIIQSILRDSIV